MGSKKIMTDFDEELSLWSPTMPWGVPRTELDFVEQREAQRIASWKLELDKREKGVENEDNV